MVSMKICFASQSFYPHIGGVSTSLLNLTKELGRLGNDIIEVHLRPSGEENTDEVEGVRVNRVPREPIDNELMREYSFFKEAIYKESHFRGRAFSKPAYQIRGFEAFNKINEYIGAELGELIKYKPADIIHVHDFQLLFTYRNIPRGVPLILSWHIPLIEDMSPILKKFLVKYLLEYDKVVFSVQEYIDVAVRAGLPREKTELIPPIANTHLFRQLSVSQSDVFERYGIPLGSKVILCVQRVDPKSGHMFLVQALPKILQAVPDAKLVFVGGESLSNKLSSARTKQAAEVKREIKKQGLESHVHWLGNVDYEALPELYNAVDMVTLCSKNEGFGLSITEGMACGKPVVGSRTGGIPTQIQHGKNGYLVEVGDADAIASSITKILKDKRLQERMGRHSLRVVHEKFRLEASIQAHLALYNRMRRAKNNFFRMEYLASPEIKAMVTDLDRTLTDHPDGPVFDPSSFNPKLIEALKTSGLQLILCTGRTLEYVRDLSQHFDIWECIVAENGAVFYFPESEGIITTNTVEMKTVKKQIAAMGLPDTEIGEVIAAINWVDRHKARKALGKQADVVQWVRNKDRLMITPFETDKGVGVRRVLDQLRIEPERTIVVGDGENDVDMFMNPGFKIALKNSHPLLKKLANQVSKKSATQGVLEILRSFRS